MRRASRIAVTGGSQGGGITIAAAALANEVVSVCMPDVPFLCHYRRAIGLTDAYPYGEIVQYLSIHRTRKEQIFHTLDYFDGLNFALRIKASCYFSTGLMDMTCPPSTVFAVHNHCPTNSANLDPVSVLSSLNQGDISINLNPYDGLCFLDPLPQVSVEVLHPSPLCFSESCLTFMLRIKV